ncbi:hypothetical protein HYU14_07270 [Candidatus Woesearchaeota archaeon]|nr:hypothetical protein [Candidatus Woesearchaeota archaeon]
MKKTANIPLLKAGLIAVLLLGLFLAGCSASKKQAEAGMAKQAGSDGVAEITQGLKDIDAVDQDLDTQDLDTIEKDLKSIEEI